MTVHSLFAQVDPNSYGGFSGLTIDPATYTMGTQFSVVSDIALTGIWFYSAPGATILPTWCGIFRRSDHAIIAEKPLGTVVWSGAAGSGWVKATFDGSVILLAGVDYKVAVGRDNASASWYSATGFFWSPTGPGSSGISDGFLTAPSSAGVPEGQSSFNAAVPAWPGSSFNSSNYWVDVEVTSTSAPNKGHLMGVMWS